MISLREHGITGITENSASVRGLAGIHLMRFDLLESTNPSNKLDKIASNARRYFPAECLYGPC